MKLLTGSVLFLILSLSLNLEAKNLKVVYGEDNREDAIDYFDLKMVLLSESVAAQVSFSKLKKIGENQFRIKGRKLESRGICKSERFSQQPMAAKCSAFLVGKDLVMTAGHCMETISDCKRNAIVFGFKKEADSSEYVVSKDDVYNCKEILLQKLDTETGEDYALIRLEREVIGRAPLSVRKIGEVDKSSILTVIGHPSGIPMKISGEGRVRDNRAKSFFVTTLDTFHGNSGSPVLNEDGLVEGILVRGEDDYEYDRVRECSVVKVCKKSECQGEDVTRTTDIKGLAKFL